MATRVGAVVVGLALAALSGCGGSDEEPPPTLPRALANDFAAQSDAIAETIDGGDPCGAAEQVRALEEAVEQAVEAGDVPPALRRPLRQGVLRLAGQVEPLCAQAPTLEDGDEDEATCEALEADKKELEEQKKEIEEAFKEDKEERERRKEEIEEEKKALDERLRECREEDDR